MNKEYIVAFGDKWYNFYINSSTGLCVNTKEGVFVTKPKVLLPDAYNDFSVAQTENGIFVVCQDMKGALIFLKFDGSTWDTKKILESREKKAEYKNIELFTINNFINLFYVIKTKDGDILVHHILDNPDSLPKVVDYISGTNFSACRRKTSDITLLYKNKDNVLGTKKLSWSKKGFNEFVPLDFGCELQDAILCCDKKDNLNIVAYATFDKFTNILYATIDDLLNGINIAAVHLVSGNSNGLSVSDYGNEKIISWCENGLVMTSFCENGKWSVPKKYIKGTANDNILFHIKNRDDHFKSYGYKQDGKIILYTAKDILNNPPEIIKNTYIDNQKSEYVKKDEYSYALAGLKKMILNQDKIINELTKKISVLERTDKANTILENEDDIDRIVAQSLDKTQI